MGECVYAKYNRHRLPRFRIETTIQREGDRKIVVKRALTPEAVDHVRDVAQAYARIRENIAQECVRLPGGFRHEGCSVACDFIDAPSLDRLLLDAFLDRDASSFRKILDDYNALLKNAFRTVSEPAASERIKKVFGIAGEGELEGRGPYFALTMIDATFENILVRDGVFWMIDNEWVFEGSLPVSFVQFRSLFYFYKVKYADFGIDSFVPLEPELERLGLDAAAVEIYRRMDDCFQRYVFESEWRSCHKNRYIKHKYSLPDLEKTIEHQRGVIKEMHDQIVVLRDLIRDKDEIIGGITNSRVCRFVQYVTRKLNAVFPQGTRRRRWVARLLKLQENDSPQSPARNGKKR